VTKLEDIEKTLSMATKIINEGQEQTVKDCGGSEIVYGERSSAKIPALTTTPLICDCFCYPNHSDHLHQNHLNSSVLIDLPSIPSIWYSPLQYYHSLTCQGRVRTRTVKKASRVMIEKVDFLYISILIMM
jgi:hypothetical protein